MRILLVDNDQDFVDLTSFALRRQGHVVTPMLDGCRTVQQVFKDKPELLLLSAEIGGSEGFALCREIRARSTIPIILVSPRGDETALVRGYEAGADDYVVKPFSPRQLLLRIDAIARRAGGRRHPDRADEGRRISVGDLVLDPAVFEVRKNGVRISVTRLEFRILSLLMHSAGTLVESSRLSGYAWQSSTDDRRSLLKTHVSHIRRKLAVAGGISMSIRSIARMGYMLSCPAADDTAMSADLLADPQLPIASPSSNGVRSQHVSVGVPR